MGFYGNITNTSNTTFSFDRIYPNRLAMDANANNDGIFIGRYVLVEYQEKAAYPVAYHATLVDGSSTQYYFYSSTNGEKISKIKYLGPAPDEPEHLPSVDDINAIYQDGFYEGEILQYYIYSPEKKDWIFSEEFYKCIGGIDGYAIFEKTVTPEMKSDYIQNFEIDENHYGQESKGFKGYDSTVWVKSSVEQNGKLITKYVNIADLNSVVPTFDIAADAPTMEPITPHFDADSTNVYYKLHTQTPYGFRVKAETNKKLSDEKTKHYKVTYDKDRNITISDPTNPDAAIYYNKEAFRAKPYIDEITGETIPVVKKDTTTINEIKIQPSGYTDNYANKYSHKPTSDDPDLVGDIQEFSLHLPAIGNMMSDAWDIIHGPNRDDAQTDNNSSLQGRLDSFKAMEKDAIPMKRNSDGTFVGSRINGNSNRNVGTNKILEENLSTSFNQDDAWIRTKIDTTGLDNTNKLSGISIHHTWHKQADTTSTTNKNTDNVSSSQVSDKIDLYTPIVDKAGHVVGKNTETVTLPYGFKTIATNGRGEDTEINTFDKVAAKTQNIVAENTQDKLVINSGNEWIRIDTDAINDILTISHDIHTTSSNSHDTDWTKTEANTTIPTTTYKFDNAGHYVSHHTENYKLPFGYGKIVGDAGNSAATATYDQIKFTSDEWLTATITEEGEDNTTVVTYSHDYPNVQEDTSTDFDMNTATTQDNKDKIVLETLRHDSAGHIINVNQHTVTLPYGYKTIKVTNNSNGVAAPASTVVETGQSADQTQDTLSLNASNKWIVLDNAENDTIKFGHKLSDLSKGWHSSSDTTLGEFGQSFKILKYETDEAGHVINSGEDTITIPKGSLNDLIETGSSVLTGISMVDETGAITQTNADVGTLKLEKYNQGTTGALKIEASDTINGAFQNIQTYINTLDMPESNSTTQFITSIKQVDGQLTVSRANAGTLVLGTDSTDKTVVAEDSLNSAINKIEARIIAEERNRSDAIDALTGTKDYSEHFDTMKEIADWLDANKDGVVDITLNVSANATAIGNEKTRAEGIEAGLQEQIDALGTAAQKNTEYFATAIQGATADTTAATIATYGDIVTHNHSEYATAVQGELADNALPKDTEFIYIEEFKDAETGEILIPEIKMTIEQLVKKVAELENEIKILKDE